MRREARENKRKLLIRRLLFGLVLLFAAGIGAVFGVNAYVQASVQDRILTEEQAAELEEIDCVLVLGCGLEADGSPSPMLHDRLQQGVALYQKEAAPKLLVSGDHGREEYDEVNAMKRFAEEQGCLLYTSASEQGRFLFGWVPTRVGESDMGNWHWGGTLVVLEVYQLSLIHICHGGNPGAFSGENKNPRHGLCLGRGFLAL